jgi:hypothetical protein
MNKMFVFHRQLVVLLILFFFSNGLLYGQLSADLVSDQPNAPTGKFTFSNNKYRLENFEHPAKIFLISNIETSQTIVFNPKDSTYIIKNRLKTPSDPFGTWELFCYDLTKNDAGTETINGLECRKTIFNKLSSNTEVIKVVRWESVKHKIPIKITYNLPQSEGFFELINIVEGPVNEELFEIPALYKRRRVMRECDD